MVGALRKAKRVRVSFEQNGESPDGISLIIDTELIRYKMAGVEGNYPEWQKLVPTEFNCQAHFDTLEAIKAVNSLKYLSNGKDYPIDLTIGDGKIVMTNPDDKGWAELVADTNGEVKVRVDGGYLAEALKACGGMVDLKLTNSYSPMLFTIDGYQLVVMPMMTTEASEQASKDRETKGAESEAEAEPSEPKTTEQSKADNTEPATEPKTKKAKRSQAKEPVTIS